MVFSLNFLIRPRKLKGTVRPDWICMRVVSLKSPLKVVTNEKGEAVEEVVTIIC
jgi:hypothetical protein